MSSLRVPLVGAAILFAAVFTPQAATAQFSAPQVWAHADRLHDEAMAPMAGYYTEADLRESVRRHGEAADLRLPNDPRAVECHRFQANLLYLAGDYTAALNQLERAAGIAVANGDFTEAALTYIDAAGLAMEFGEKRQAARLVGEAQHLATNAGPEGRARIQQRFN